MACGDNSVQIKSPKEKKKQKKTQKKNKKQKNRSRANTNLLRKLEVGSGAIEE